MLSIGTRMQAVIDSLNAEAENTIELAKSQRKGSVEQKRLLDAFQTIRKAADLVSLANSGL